MTTPTPALAILTQALGPPDSDSGFATSFSEFGTCPGDRVRAVRWKGLTVLFARGPTELRPDGAPHLLAFQYGPKSREPVLSTAEGVGIGTTLEQLRAAYGDRVSVSADDPFQKPEFRLGTRPRQLVGVLSGGQPAGTVELIDGGALCGE